jgi:hypothetical protein
MATRSNCLKSHPSRIRFPRIELADGIGANAPERLFVVITGFALSKMGMLIGRGIIDPNIR